MKNTLLALLFLPLTLTAKSLAPAAPPPETPPPAAQLVFHELHYDAKVTDREARFVVDIVAESAVRGEVLAPLFTGDIAVLPPKLPAGLRLERQGNQYRLIATRPGKYQFKIELVAKITRAEPWNQVSFTGPPAAIASVTAQGATGGVELQLLTGTVIESSAPVPPAPSASVTPAARSSIVRGFLGADNTVALRWKSRVAEIARRALLTADTTVTAHISPTVIKFTTQLRYDILQGSVPRLTLALPASHALTRLVGEQIRDWRVAPDGERQLLTVEFIKPVEKAYSLTLFSEQTVEGTSATAPLVPPQPLEVERESGSFSVTAEDTLVEVDSAAGLRQVNAPGGAFAAYRFNGRPFTLALKLRRIEPVVQVADRVTTRLEETRLLVSHALALNVEKAGIYVLELTPQPGFVVAEVRGDGVEDWKVADGKLRVNFSARVLGARQLEVQLEQALKTFPDQIVVAPLRVTGAAKETAELGAAASPGIRVKTAELNGLREVPVHQLSRRSDELLAFTAEQPDWRASLASERLAARIVADIFNLVTIGDGLVGGSATVRYGLLNQGVQEFRVKLPAHWKNVEFTGPNIRRKEQADDTWTIGLQEKAWDGYTLVVTYDFQFDPQGATLALGGIRCLDAERETGSVAITTAASLKLTPKTATGSVRRVDESELSAADRSFITRPVLIAHRYAGGEYELAVDVKRFDELPVLSAVADRTQLTTVLTEAGEMLTQASFMVKNNDKQFQRFQLPRGANFWACYVNGQPAKPERDGDWLLVPLPRGANRDQAFAVDIVYAGKRGALKSLWPQSVALVAPKTDVPNTYAEWQLYAPATHRLAGFGGNMTVARGTEYGLHDAWRQFVEFYEDFLREAGVTLVGIGAIIALVVAVVASAVRRGWHGVLAVFVVFAVVAVMASMMLPALSKAKAKATRIKAASNLKQIGLAVRLFSEGNKRLPASLEEILPEVVTEKVLTDPQTSQRFVYVGGSERLEGLRPESVLAYSPVDNNGRNVLYADGSVEVCSTARFDELLHRGLVARVTPEQEAVALQVAAVREKQLNEQAGAAVPAKSPVAFGLGGNITTVNGAAIAATSTPATVPLSEPAPMASGLRPIRIEIPRAGQPFVFTKVLNVQDEPLTIRTEIMTWRTFQMTRMIAQLAAFVAGLGLLLWQWRRVTPNTFLLTLAVVLMGGAVTSLFLSWRTLHTALILGAPAVGLAALAWAVWKFWPRKAAFTAPEASGGHATANGLPPVVAGLALLLWLNTSASAAEASIANQQPSIAGVSLLSAVYTGTINDRVAQLEVTLKLVADKPDQTIALFDQAVAVQQFTAKGGGAKLVRQGGTVSVRLARAGEVTLQMKLLVKPGGDVTKRQLAFAIPPALSSRFAVNLDQPEADVDFPTAVSYTRTSGEKQTRVEAILGAGESVDLRWTPRVKRAGEIAATVFVQNAALVTLGGGAVNVRATLDYTVTQGELRQLRVRLPAGHRLLRVEGDGIRNWDVKANGEEILNVELLKGASPNYRLTVETEKPLDALPALAPLESPHALDVKRETGLVAVRGAEELELAVHSTVGLQRVDSEEFSLASGTKVTGLFSVFRFLKPEFDLRLRAAVVEPHIEAVARNTVRVGAEQLALSATVDYTIKRAGVFALRLALPAGYRVEKVVAIPAAPAGGYEPQWFERAEGNGRVLEVALKERTSGAFSLRVELQQTLRELPKTLALADVHPLGVQKLTGFITVTAEPGVAVKTAALEGLTEIPAAAAGSGSGALAFKFITAEPKAGPAWKLSVATETVAPWVRAEIVNFITLTETLVSGRALVRFDIANAPVKELRLRIPAAFRNVEVAGANIRRRDQDGEQWRVELQSKVRGAYTLTVTWEQPREAGTNALAVAGVGAGGVERETGFLAIVARAPLQVSEQAAGELIKVDPRELPDWAGRAGEATVLAYRYLRPGYRLALEAKRFDEAEVLQALVESARLTTVVADDGQTMTEMSLAVRNNGRQHLEVELPPGATVWSAFVGGQPVRPSRRAGKLLLPLERSGADEAPVTVELIYVGGNPFPRGRGRVDFASPQLDVPMKNVRWEVYLPPDYEYRRFAGTMSRESLAAVAPAAASFTLSDYTKQERYYKSSQLEGSKSAVSSAQRKLSSGNVKEAVDDYNRARGQRLNADAEEDKDLKQLQSDLAKAQASNLLKAQTDYITLNNDGAGVVVAGKPMQAGVRYDSAAAEAQWVKLQQAQELAVARVQPLRVNLPTRGQRYAFTQVLQTEIGKAMTIELEAVNLKTVSWTSRIAGSLLGFVVLWAMVAFVAHRPAARNAQ